VEPVNRVDDAHLNYDPGDQDQYPSLSSR
jgi:hypothetical protein